MDNAVEETSPAFQRPGISGDTLVRAGIRHVNPEEAFNLCGLSASGIWIPYSDVQGSPIIINGKEYGRLRLDEPRGDMKYYQAPDSGSHVYIPYPFASSYKPNEPLYLTEGEFKSLALAEENYQSASLPGFYGYAHGELLPDLEALLDKEQPSKIYFIGDNDTCLNHLFSVAVMKFAEMVNPIPVFLPRIPLDKPKGIDDVKEAAGNVFKEYFERVTMDARQVDIHSTAANLASNLLAPEIPRLKSNCFGDLGRDKALNRMIKMSAYFSQEDFIVVDTMMEHICNIFQLRRKVVEKTVSKEVSKMREAFKRSHVPREESEGSRIFFDGKGYWRREGDGNYHRLTREDVELDLKQRRFTPWPNEGEITSPLENELFRIQKENRVDYAGTLCGRPVGLYDENGYGILVTKGPDFNEGASGDPSFLIEFFSNLLGKGANDPHWDIQFKTFAQWLRRFRCAMRNPHDHLPGQMLGLVGPKDVGKTLGQDIISRCLGGRSADPSLWLQGKSTFNGEMWCAEHLILSDANLEDDPRHKQLFRDKLKEIVANSTYPLHRKGKDVINARPIWRITLSANDDPDSGFILPALDDNNADKIIYLKVYPPPVPFPTGSEFEYPAFYKKLVDAVPAFVKFIDEAECPDELRKGRFGIREFHHPDILELINAHNPNTEFAEHLETWIDGWLPVTTAEKSLAAGELYMNLAGHRWGVFKNICKSPKHLGHLMRKLSGSPGWKGRIIKETRRIGVNRSEHTAWRILKNQPQN